jgi:pimeloyl-ACP methyl ester carboxylesterase
VKRPVLRSAILLSAVALTASVPAERSRDLHEIRIDVDGLSIRALCTDGRRDVILMHGGSSTADTWIPVLQRLDGEVGACAYDRRGNGQSFPGPDPRGWYEFLDEMRRIHLALGFDRGYVVSGHSLGGLYARLFTIDRPADVSGLILLDPAHENMFERIRAGMPPEEYDRWTTIQRSPNEDGIVEVELGERLRTGRLPEIPVTILTATIRQDGGGWDQRFVNEGARQVHASILRGVVAGRHIPAQRSGHEIQLDEPQLVADEILRVVRIAR